MQLIDHDDNDDPVNTRDMDIRENKLAARHVQQHACMLTCMSMINRGARPHIHVGRTA